MMDVVSTGNAAAIGCWDALANTTLFVGDVRVEAPVEAGSRRAAWGDGAPGSAVQL